MMLAAFFLIVKCSFQQGLRAIFHMMVEILLHSERIFPLQFPRNSAFLRPTQFHDCTIFWHSAVKAVHFARFKRDTPS